MSVDEPRQDVTPSSVDLFVGFDSGWALVHINDHVILDDNGTLPDYSAGRRV